MSLGDELHSPVGERPTCHTADDGGNEILESHRLYGQFHYANPGISNDQVVARGDGEVWRMLTEQLMFPTAREEKLYAEGKRAPWAVIWNETQPKHTP
jgi:hypothetical protein